MARSSQVPRAPGFTTLAYTHCEQNWEMASFDGGATALLLLQGRPPRRATWPLGQRAARAEGTALCEQRGQEPPRKFRRQGLQTSQGLLPSRTSAPSPVEGMGLTTQGGRGVLQGLAHSQQKTCVGRREER